MTDESDPYRIQHVENSNVIGDFTRYADRDDLENDYQDDEAQTYQSEDVKSTRHQPREGARAGW